MKHFKLAALCLLLLLVGACEEEEDFSLRFGHFLHVEETGMECSDCHGEVDQGKFSPPDHETCVDCHEDLIDADEIAKDTCGVCHTVKDLDTIGDYEEEEPKGPQVFRHTESLEGACADCHGMILEEGVDYPVSLSGETLVEVREKAHASGRACIACHEEMDPQVKPADHRRNWTRLHGTAADVDSPICTVCHQEENCRECHQKQAPITHNNLWRLKTHGMEASWSRERCMVCHQEDMCVVCHRETRPRSHGAGWHRRHCFYCHSSQESGSGCETCHPGGIEVHGDIQTPVGHTYYRSCAEQTGTGDSACHDPVNGDPERRLDPSRHPFLDDSECAYCHPR